MNFKRISIVSLTIPIMLWLTGGVIIWGSPALEETGQSIGISFTGQLEFGGQPVTDASECDFIFKAYDTDGGTELRTQEQLGVPIDNGQFTTSIVFTNTLELFNGEGREIGAQVRCPSRMGNYIPLGPRLDISATPYSVYAHQSPWSGLLDIPAGFSDGIDDNTTYNAGDGILGIGTGSNITFTVDFTAVQPRITITCFPTGTIQTINENGTVVCDEDDILDLSSGLDIVTSNDPAGRFQAIGNATSLQGISDIGIAGFFESGNGRAIYAKNNSPRDNQGRSFATFKAVNTGGGISGVFETGDSNAVNAVNNSVPNAGRARPTIFATNIGVGSTIVITNNSSPNNQGMSFATIRAENTGGGLAGFFDGGINSNSILSISQGTVQIDHPLDPENKYMNHALVESPDMMTIYNGNVKMDTNGAAVVQMPNWFEARNMEFRYQLTPIGGPAPNIHIAEEITNNRFKIAGGKPGMKISWQVTGIRNDPYAQMNPIDVEQEKPQSERGTYIHPLAYGKSEELGVDQLYKQYEADKAQSSVIQTVPENVEEESKPDEERQ